MYILNFMLKFNKWKNCQIPIDTPKIELDEIDENANTLLEIRDLEEIAYE